MFTINVVHEVRWLPNDVEARLARLEEKIDKVLKRLPDPAVLQALQDSLKSSTDALDSAVKSQSQ